MSNSLYLNGPVDPGNSLLINNNYSQPQQNSKTKSSNNKKDDSIPNAYEGQTFDFKIMQSEIKTQKIQLTNQLKNILINDYQNDKSSFLSDRNVNSIIKQIHLLDAKEASAKNAIEQEKVSGERFSNKMSSYNAESDYAVSKDGRRYYYDNITGELKTASESESINVYKNGQDFLTNEELYNYNRKGLSIQNGEVEQFNWSDPIDNKAKHFNNELNKKILNSSNKIEETGTLIKQGALLGTNSPSFLLSGKTTIKSNFRNLNNAVESMMQNLSPEAQKDAKMQYWKDGWDKFAVIVKTKKDKNGKNYNIFEKASIEDAEKAFKTPANKINKLTIDQQKLLVDGGILLTGKDKFNYWVEEKAKAARQGLDIYSTDTDLNYHKKTEAELQYGYDMKKMTTMEVYGNSKFVETVGVRNNIRIYSSERNPTKYKKGIYKVYSDIESYKTLLGTETSSDIVNMNLKYNTEIRDDEGEIIVNKLKTIEEMGFGGSGFIGYDGASVLSREQTKDLYFISASNEIVTMPIINENPDGTAKVKINQNNNNPTRIKMGSYQKITVALSPDQIEKYKPYIVGEQSNVDEPGYNNDNTYTYGNANLNDDYFWDYDLSDEAKLLGAKEVPIDGGWDNYMQVEIYIPLKGGNEGLSATGDSANSHNSEVNRATLSQQNNRLALEYGH